METQTKIIHLRDLKEEIWTEIIARLPLRSIARCKSVSKTWKSTIESVYFRRLYVSLHQKSSSYWSLMNYRGELIGFHGYSTLELRKSLSSFLPECLFCVIKASSNGLVLISGYDDCAFVGNQFLQQWIKIPQPPSVFGDSSVFGLVTRVDEDGFGLGFKVIRLADIRVQGALSVLLYSSETGIWSSKIIQRPQITDPKFLTLNGSIYYSRLSEPGVLAAYDFYSESSEFRVISLPDQPNDIYKTSLTTSGGFVMYIRALAQSSSSQNVLKVWRLNNDDTWQLLWEISLPLLIGEYLPMAMHPFDSDTVYLWSQENRHVVSLNLQTQMNKILRDGGNDDDDDHQDCFINKPICDQFVDVICKCKSSVELSQLVLPLWMESLPCPPQAEMMDPTSLFPYVEATLKQKAELIFGNRGVWHPHRR